MKLTVPYLGLLHKAYKPVLEKIGVQMVLPPPPTKRTLDLGTKYSPEFACLPFKVTLGSMIEALELGADTIFMPGGWGPCRFGYFDVIQELILKELGYHFVMGSANNPDVLYDMIKMMQSISGLHSKTQLYRLFFFILLRLSFLDWVSRRYFHSKPYEANPGESDRIYNTAIEMIERSLSLKELVGAALKISSSFRKMKRTKSFTPIRVGIVGELFTVIEPSGNMEMDRILLKRGVEIYKSIWLSDYLNDRFHFNPLRRNQHRIAERYARPFLRCHVGGESTESIGKSVLFARKGLDGVIHVFPFTCMPELVAQTILTKVQKVFDLPILTLIFDEHTASGGVEMRIEAFLDLLERRKKG
jgi:predicted nucleotide-binding protein (sugar kinase/HSP70/actin superfamily)